jgi:hypothetical protein
LLRNLFDQSIALEQPGIVPISALPLGESIPKKFSVDARTIRSGFQTSRQDIFLNDLLLMFFYSNNFFLNYLF